MSNWLEDLFNLENLMPHGYCLLWKPELLWMHVISDIVIAFAYFSIPVTMYIFFKKNDAMVPYRWVFGMFAIFIFFCGLTHLAELVTLWQPIYYIEGILKLLTAAASVATAVMIFPLIPLIVSQLKTLDDDSEQEN